MEYLYKDLVKEAKRGNKIAMEDLIKKLNPLIYSAIGRYKGGRDAEDLYQDACILILEAIRDFDEERGVPFLAFAKSRVYYGIHNLNRKNSYELSLDQPRWEEDGQSILDQLEDTEAGVEDSVAKSELFETLRNAINSLTQKQRQVITSYYFEGKKLKDIATDRGVHYKAVLRLKDRAIKELYECLENLS